MHYFTHTLENNDYFAIVIILLSFSATSLSYHIYLRWLIDRNWNVYSCQMLIKSIIILFWVYLLPFSLILNTNYYNFICSFMFGILGGIIVISLDRYIIIHFIKKYDLRTSVFDHKSSNNTGDYGLNFIKNISNYQSKNEKYNTYKFYKKIKTNNINLILSVLTAFMEEIIFRGFLFKTALLLGNNNIDSFLYISVITIIFSISHITMGIPQVVAKFFLGLVTTTIVILTDSVLGAIISHCMLNVRSYQKMRKVNQSKVIL